MNVAGETIPGWCNDHTKVYAKSSGGYSNPMKYESNNVTTPYLDWYMTQYEKNEEIRQASGLTNDNDIKDWLTAGNGEQYGWGGGTPWFHYANAWELEIMFTVSQYAVWLYGTGKLTDESSIDEIAELVGKERHKIMRFKGWAGSTEEDIAAAKAVLTAWHNGGYTHYDFYEYFPNSSKSQTQPILVPKPTPKDYSGYIKLKKVDENGQPLAGAAFGIYTDKDCTDKLATITTTTDEWNYSGELKLDGKTQELWVKELDAPPGYVPNAKPWPVTVDSTTNNTKETAAAVNGGTAIKNVPLDRPGVVKKVDTNGNPIGPATFNFCSIEKNTDRTITSDASGVIELQ